MNLMLLLEMAASAYGDRVAVQSGSQALSYRELLEASSGAAREVSASGARQLALLDVNSLAVPVAIFGAAYAGVPFVPLSYRLTGAELDALLERLKPALLVTEEERVERLEGPGIRALARVTFIECSRAGGAAGEPLTQADDVAVLLFTSGTTGVPKAAVLRHRHLVSYILGSVEFGSAAETDAALVAVPPYHVAGIAAVLSGIYSGRRIVQMTGFDAAEWVRVVREERITNAFVVPTMLGRIVDLLPGGSPPDLSTLRAISYGGGKMPQPVIERAMRLLPHVDFTNAYGLTETSSTITLLGPEDHRAAFESDDPAIRRRLGSVGRPLPGLQLEVRDEEGKPLPAGQRGEIWVRGEQVSGEYLGRGSQLDAQGWFPTRDGGWLDEDGYVFVEGRVDDVIVRGAENLSPGEIEDVLLEHAAVADCAVVGIPDEQWGETVAAAIVLKPGQRASVPELQDWVRAKLRSSRTPQHIEFRDALPYNETGKLLRRVVRAELGQGTS